MMSLPIPICVVMESSINGLLALDEYSRENAAPLSGKVIKIEIVDWNIAFYLSISNRQQVMVMSYGEDADVVIRATSVNLAKMSQMEDANRMVLNQGVLIHGDVGTVSQVQAFLASIHIDWEEHLSRLTGDMIAHKIGSSVRAGAAWLRQSAKSLAQDMSEYARYEAEWLPDQLESENFAAQVNEIRNDVERLEARMKRLLHKLKSNSNSGSAA